jgi:hypothetical protein
MGDGVCRIQGLELGGRDLRLWFRVEGSGLKIRGFGFADLGRGFQRQGGLLA